MRNHVPLQLHAAYAISIQHQSVGSSDWRSVSIQYHLHTLLWICFHNDWFEYILLDRTIYSLHRKSLGGQQYIKNFVSCC